jgi:hypothetical protein
LSDFDEFKSYYALADKLMGAMTPEQLADCLRIWRFTSGTIDYGSGRYRDRISLLCSGRPRSATIKLGC